MDFYTPSFEAVEDAKGARVLTVDKVTGKVKVSSTAKLDSSMLPPGSYVMIQGSANNEITGLEALFSEDIETLYGVDKEESVMKAYMQEDVGEITENIIQKAVDDIEENSGSRVNFMICSWGVRRAILDYYRQNNIKPATVEIGGVTAIDFNGIPIVTDRFCPNGTLYLLNTDDFKLHQLCDWQWLEGEDGKVLKQIPGKPVYTATLVKYAELICSRPCGQGKLSGITEM